MTNSRSCPECGRPTKFFARGLCHSMCYRRALRRGLVDAPPTTKRTKEDVGRVVSDFLALRSEHPNWTQKAIARRLGVPASTLSNMLRNRGIVERPLNDYDALIENYWALRASGWHEASMVDIAQRLGVSDRTLYRALKNCFAEDEYDYA